MTNILSTGYVTARAALRRGEAPPEPTPRIGLLVIPLFHVTACSASLMGSMVAGNTTIFMRKWDTVEAMRIIERERVQITGGVPTIAWQILEHPDRDQFDLSSLETDHLWRRPVGARAGAADLGGVRRACPATAGG